jgi:hypothetical protein
MSIDGGIYVKKARKMENDDKNGKLKCFSMVWWNAAIKHTPITKTIATTMASNYWTAMANATVAKCVTQEQQQEAEEEARWNQHKFGLCPMCKVGLDDRADFMFNYKFDTRNGVMMCHECSGKEYLKMETCANCENIVGGGDIVSSRWDRKTGKFSVRFCRFC